MPEYIGGGGDSKIEKVLFVVAIAAVILLGVVMARPAWDGDNMIKEIKSDCAARHGVMLEHSNAFGTSYQCASRLDT